MGKFDSKSFNEKAFKYGVEHSRVPNLKTNELKKSKALKGSKDIRGVFTSQNGTVYAEIAIEGLLDGDAVNYDGKTDITTSEIEGDTQSGTAYKRMKAWTARDFINDVQGADPMGHIIGRVAKYWNKYRQRQIIKLLNGVFGITGDTELSQHIYNVATTGANVTDANKIGATTLNDAITKALCR